MASNMIDDKERQRRIELVGDYRFQTGESYRKIAKYFSSKEGIDGFDISETAVKSYVELYMKNHPEKREIMLKQTEENISNSIKNDEVRKRVLKVADLIIQGYYLEQISEFLKEPYWVIYRDVNNRLTMIDKKLYDKVKELMSERSQKNLIPKQKKVIETPSSSLPLSDDRKKFYILLSLKFRLSLRNLCTILKVEPTEDNQMKLYKELVEYSTYKLSSYASGVKYLFMYETLTESDEYSLNALSQAIQFLLNLKNAETKEEKEEIKNLLLSEEHDLSDLIKSYKQYATNIKYQIIAKYRLKKGMSIATFRYLNGGTNQLRIYEQTYCDEDTKRRLDMLNDYNNELEPVRKR